MTGRYVLSSARGPALFIISEADGKYTLEIEIFALPLPLQADKVEKQGDTLLVQTSFMMKPGLLACMRLTYKDEAYTLEGEHIILGALSGRATRFTGKTKTDVMTEELPQKRTGKTVKRTPRQIDEEVEALLAQMTLDEKIGQMSQSVGDFSAAIGGTVANALSEEERIRRGMIGAVNGMGTLSMMFHQQKIAVEESRLGIPLLFCQDVIHGKHTIFPIPLAWACSFNPPLVQEASRIAAKEATSMGVMYNMAPMVDIARDPRWGRVAEGAGEDPYLGSLMSEAQVRGYQGDSLYSADTMMATLKHYIGYGAAEGGRDYNTVELGGTTLRNIYLPPFKAGIKAGAASVMTAFNVINGVPIAVNKPILKDLLRGELGFEGVVISDYGSIDECLPHGIAEDIADAAAKALMASLDIEMATTAYQDNLGALVQSGRVDKELIDAAVRRILRYKYESGLIDDPYKYFRPEDAEKAYCEEYLVASRELARQSAVLLKNSGVLPLKKGQKLALIGPKGDSKDLLGPWQFSPRSSDTVTLCQGLEAAGFSVTCEMGCEVQASIEGGIEASTKVAQNADVVILALGETAEMSGEAASLQSIQLPAPQWALAKAMKRLGKPLVLVLTNGRPLLLEWFEKNVDAIVESWFLGSQAGAALADILSGEYNPSGKLSITFPRHAGQIPLYYNHLNTGRPYKQGDTNKFLSRYLDGSNTPLYHFGYGLSYTTFEVKNLALSAEKMNKEGRITASVNIKNIGEKAGTQVVQLYLRDVAASIARPVKELKSFERVDLQPEESRKISFNITEAMLRFYNVAGQEVSEPGRFEIMVGTSSDDRDLERCYFTLE